MAVPSLDLLEVERSWHLLSGRCTGHHNLSTSSPCHTSSLLQHSIKDNLGSLHRGGVGLHDCCLNPQLSGPGVSLSLKVVGLHRDAGSEDEREMPKKQGEDLCSDN